MSINVNYAALERLAGALRTSSDKLNHTRDNLQKDLGPLVSTWEGEAQSAWQVKQRAWDQAHEDLTQVLAQISAVVENARANYQSGENKATQMFG